MIVLDCRRTRSLHACFFQECGAFAVGAAFGHSTLGPLSTPAATSTSSMGTETHSAVYCVNDALIRIGRGNHTGRS